MLGPYPVIQFGTPKYIISRKVLKMFLMTWIFNQQNITCIFLSLTLFKMDLSVTAYSIFSFKYGFLSTKISGC